MIASEVHDKDVITDNEERLHSSVIREEQLRLAEESSIHYQ
jgi:hypothetical protein